MSRKGKKTSTKKPFLQKIQLNSIKPKPKVMAGVESKIVEEKPKEIRPAIDREKVRFEKMQKLSACFKID